MKETASPDKLQGQLIATNALLEAILRTLPSQTMKEIARTHAKIAPEVAGHLLNTSGSDTVLDAYQMQVDAHVELLGHIQREAIFRDAAAGRL